LCVVTQYIKDNSVNRTIFLLEDSVTPTTLTF